MKNIEWLTVIFFLGMEFFAFSILVFFAISFPLSLFASIPFFIAWTAWGIQITFYL